MFLYVVHVGNSFRYISIITKILDVQKVDGITLKNSNVKRLRSSTLNMFCSTNCGTHSCIRPDHGQLLCQSM